MKWSMKMRLVCIVLCCMMPCRMVAQEVQEDTIAGKVHQIEKVTVTARRMPNKVTSTVPVQTMSKQDISQLGIQNMADAVRRFAGVDVKDYGGIGGLKTVSIRNMGAAHTAVSYDGVAVSNCQAGQIDIGRFSLDNVSILSLSIGQSEDLLQSARLYASAGVLNIETEKPHFEGNRTSAFLARARGGSFGYVAPSVRWWQKLGERTRLSVDVGYMRADGNYPFTLVNGKYVTREKRNNSQVESWQGEATLYHTFKDGGELDVKGYYYYSARELPGGVTLYNPISDEKLWDENFFTQARYKKKFSAKWTLQAQAKYNHSWNRYQDKGVEYTDGVYREVHRQDEYYLSATLLYQPLEDLTFSLAQDGVANTLRNSLPACPFPTRYTSISALNGRYRTDWMTATASLVYTATSEHVEQGDKPDNFHRLAPSVTVSVQPWQDESLFFRLMYKSTFRLPTFNDLYYFRMGNRDLRPEKANEYNVGITWSRSKWTIFDFLSMTVDGYFNNVTDKIVAFPTIYVWKMANYGKVHATGVDATLSASIPLFKSVGLFVSGSYMWQKAIDLTEPDGPTYKDQLPYTPLHSGNAAMVIENPWVNIGYSVVGVGKRYFLSQNIPANEIDGYVEHTLSLSHEFALKDYRLSVQAELVNLTDEQYDVIKYYPMPGRSWRLTGIFKF